MKKSVYIFVLILSMFSIYTIPTYGEPFLKLDEWDPVDDQYILTPGLALNVGISASDSSSQRELDSTWTLNENSGIKGACIMTFDEYNYLDNCYIGMTLFWKAGLLYGEIGPAFSDQGLFVLHTGLNGFFPQNGRSGPAFENNFNICLSEIPFNGIIKGGWMWLFGKHSHLLIGGSCEYRDGFGGLYIKPHLGLVELSIDDEVGPFLFDGKVKWALLDGDGVDANISLSFMPIPWFGLGVEYNLSTSSIGGTLKVRI